MCARRYSLSLSQTNGPGRGGSCDCNRTLSSRTWRAFAAAILTSHDGMAFNVPMIGVLRMWNVCEPCVGKNENVYYKIGFIRYTNHYSSHPPTRSDAVALSFCSQHGAAAAKWKMGCFGLLSRRSHWLLANRTVHGLLVRTHADEIGRALCERSQPEAR
jgi:hypothetical protein